MLYEPVKDVGLSGVGLQYGVAWAAFAFVVTVLLEALLMRRYLETSRSMSLRLSFGMNVISTGLGIPMALIGFASLPLFIWVIVSYLLTVPLELLVLRAMWKTPTPTSRLFRFVAFANLASYCCVFVLPWAAISIYSLRAA
jgi:hypothetical protein